MSSFFGIELGSRALRAFQLGLNVTGHNIANVGTPGYTRQRLELQASPEFRAGNRLLQGTGVLAVSIQRARDLFLEQRANENGAGLSRFTALRDGVRGIEGVLQEPSDQGLNSLMNAFFNSLDELATRPDSIAVRQNVAQKAQAVAAGFQRIFAGMKRQEQEALDLASSYVTEANRMASEVARLNQDIRAAQATNNSPNDLLDQRDALVNKLTGLTGARAFYAADGTVTLFVGEHTLVQDYQANALPTNLDVDQPGLTGASGNVKLAVGQIAGLLETAKLARSYQKELDAVAQTMIERFNELHQAGFDLNGGTGRVFFTGAGASDIALNTELIDPRNLAAASVSGAPGNGDLARQLAELRSDPQSNLGGLSLSAGYRSLVSLIANDAQTYKNSAEAQKLVTEHFENLRESVSGVSLDEEASAMVRYQRSYQAAAKLISTFDSMIEDLLSIV